MGHNKYKMFNFLKGEYNYKFLDISHFFEFQSYTVIFCQQSHNCLVLSHVFFSLDFSSTHLCTYSEYDLFLWSHLFSIQK